MKRKKKFGVDFFAGTIVLCAAIAILALFCKIADVAIKIIWEIAQICHLV